MVSYWLHLLLRVLVIEPCLKRKLETCLIPTLKPGQIVIADHATFMKGGRILQLIEAAGCQLKYLPPYSPDLNKIERCWSWLKSRIRKQLIKFDCRAGCNGSRASHSGLTALAVAI
jgi:transposase